MNAALVQQFLDISVAERKMVVQPDRVLDDRHWKTVAVRFGIGHVGSAYPSPIKATQPASRPFPGGTAGSDHWAVRTSTLNFAASAVLRRTTHTPSQSHIPKP